MSSPIVAQPFSQAPQGYPPQYNGGSQNLAGLGYSNSDMASMSAGAQPPATYGGSGAYQQLGAQPKHQSNASFWLWIAAAVAGTAGLTALAAWAISSSKKKAAAAEGEEAGGSDAAGQSSSADSANAKKGSTLALLQEERTKLEEKVKTLGIAAAAAKQKVAEADAAVAIAETAVNGGESPEAESKKLVTDAENELHTALKTVDEKQLQLNHAKHLRDVGIKLDQAAAYINRANEKITAASTAADNADRNQVNPQGAETGLQASPDNAQLLAAVANNTTKAKESFDLAKAELSAANQATDVAVSHADILAKSITEVKASLASDIAAAKIRVDEKTAVLDNLQGEQHGAIHSDHQDVIAQKVAKAKKELEQATNFRREAIRLQGTFNDQTINLEGLKNTAAELKQLVGTAAGAEIDTLKTNSDAAKTRAEGFDTVVNSQRGYKASYDTQDKKAAVTTKEGELMTANKTLLQSKQQLKLRQQHAAIYDPDTIKANAEAEEKAARDAHEAAQADLRVTDHALAHFGKA